MGRESFDLRTRKDRWVNRMWDNKQKRVYCLIRELLVFYGPVFVASLKSGTTEYLMRTDGIIFVNKTNIITSRSL